MKNKFFVLVCIFPLFFLSCVSSDEEIQEEVMPTEPVIEEQQIEEESEIIDEPTIEEQIIEEEEPETPEEESQDEVYFEEDVVEIIEEDAEYLRSINDIEVKNEVITKDEFTEDKAAILKIIDELSDTMKNFNFEKWKTYIDPVSIEYYSNHSHLRKAQKMLPDKTIHLKGLRDYFRYVFIPSRKVSKVDEIRYISRTYVKAVEVREEDNTTVVYYYFVKNGDKWLVHIPEL